MKRFLSLLFAFAFLLSFYPSVMADAPNGTVTARIYDYTQNIRGPETELPVVNLRLNGESVEGEMPGMILNGRTMAPLRLLAEGLNAQVEWLPNETQVVIRREQDTIVLTLGATTASVNGEERPLPDGVPATMVFRGEQGYTMVPARFFSETLGCRVDWEQESYTASVIQPSAEMAALLSELDKPVDPSRFLIALDAGHGGPWSGAYYESTAEKDLNLAMTLKLNEILQALGYRTLLTRKGDEDVGLKERSNIANRAAADIFVSIHCNAAEKNPDFQGLYVYHYPGSVPGKALAQAIQAPACSFTGAVDRDIDSANFSVVRESYMPAVLVETGFMSCHEELVRLKDDWYQTRMAQGIAQGIISYLNTID